MVREHPKTPVTTTPANTDVVFQYDVSGVVTTIEGRTWAFVRSLIRAGLTTQAEVQALIAAEVAGFDAAGKLDTNLGNVSAPSTSARNAFIAAIDVLKRDLSNVDNSLTDAQRAAFRARISAGEAPITLPNSNATASYTFQIGDLVFFSDIDRFYICTQDITIQIRHIKTTTSAFTRVHVPQVTAAEITAGTETEARGWSPANVAAAAALHGASMASGLDEAAVRILITSYVYLNQAAVDARITALREANFTSAEKSKLQGIEAAAKDDQSGNEMRLLLNGTIGNDWQNLVTGIDASVSGQDLTIALSRKVGGGLSDVVALPAGMGGGGGLAAVETDATLTGDGTSGDTLKVANPFTDADESKLDDIQAGAKDDQTAAEIKTALETLSGTARLSADAVKDLPQPGDGGLASVASDATLTGNGTSGSPLKVANPFSDADESKLDDIEPSATADQSGEEMRVALTTELGGNSWHNSISSVDLSISGQVLSLELARAFGGALNDTVILPTAAGTTFSISALTAYDSPIDGDFLAILDITNGVIKKIRVDTLEGDIRIHKGAWNATDAYIQGSVVETTVGSTKLFWIAAQFIAAGVAEPTITDPHNWWLMATPNHFRGDLTVNTTHNFLDGDWYRVGNRVFIATADLTGITGTALTGGHANIVELSQLAGVDLRAAMDDAIGNTWRNTISGVNLSLSGQNLSIDLDRPIGSNLQDTVTLPSSGTPSAFARISLGGVSINDDDTPYAHTLTQSVGLGHLIEIEYGINFANGLGTGGSVNIETILKMEYQSSTPTDADDAYEIRSGRVSESGLGSFGHAGIFIWKANDSTTELTHVYIMASHDATGNAEMNLYASPLGGPQGIQGIQGVPGGGGDLSQDDADARYIRLTSIGVASGDVATLSTNGKWATGRIPFLPASIINDGEFHEDRIPTIPVSGISGLSAAATRAIGNSVNQLVAVQSNGMIAPGVYASPSSPQTWTNATELTEDIVYYTGITPPSTATIIFVQPLHSLANKQLYAASPIFYESWAALPNSLAEGANQGADSDRGITLSIYRDVPQHIEIGRASTGEIAMWVRVDNNPDENGLKVSWM